MCIKGMTVVMVAAGYAHVGVKLVALYMDVVTGYGGSGRGTVLEIMYVGVYGGTPLQGFRGDTVGYRGTIEHGLGGGTVGYGGTIGCGFEGGVVGYGGTWLCRFRGDILGYKGGFRGVVGYGGPK